MDKNTTIKKLKFYFKVCWLGLAIGIPLSAIIVGAFAVMCGVVYGFHLLYLLWTLIPPSIARTTPGKAVGFSFIPVFNIYWVFVTYKGLAEDMNKTLKQHGIQYQVNENLGLAICVLVILCYVPVVNIAAFLAAIVVWIFFLKSVKDGALLLLEKEN